MEIDSHVFNPYLLPGCVPWCMSEYAQDLGKIYAAPDSTKENALDMLFPPGDEHSSEDKFLDSPCIIVDAEDNILAWYLPNIISRDAQVNFHFYPCYVHLLCPTE